VRLVKEFFYLFWVNISILFNVIVWRLSRILLLVPDWKFTLLQSGETSVKF